MFVYRMIPPRPTFHLDTSDDEREVIVRHVAYWQEHTDAGRMLVFGPVVVGGESWGLAVISVDDPAEAERMIAGDPAISSGLCRAELGTMPAYVLPG